MEIKEQHKEIIINCGALGYPPEKIASILDLPPKEVISEINKPNSPFSALLQKGKDMADYSIDLKLFEMAKGGDIKAIEKLEQRKRVNKKM